MPTPPPTQAPVDITQPEARPFRDIVADMEADELAHPWLYRWYRLRRRVLDACDVPWHYRRFRNTVIRGRRGYGPHDSWNADSYLATVMAGVLRQLRDTTDSYPHGLDPDQWSAALTRWADDLEAYPKHYGECLDSECMDSAHGEYKARFETAMAELAEWWPALWD